MESGGSFRRRSVRVRLGSEATSLNENEDLNLMLPTAQTCPKCHRPFVGSDAIGYPCPDCRMADIIDLDSGEGWLCENGHTMEVVPKGERCRICGKTKREKH